MTYHFKVFEKVRNNTELVLKLHYKLIIIIIIITIITSTAVGQLVVCAPVTQRARVRSPVGTSFLGEFFSGLFLTCKTNVRKP